MKYEEPRVSGAGDEQSVAESLIALALQSEERALVERRIEELSAHGSVIVRRACAVALGHVARLHRAVDAGVAQRVLQKLSADPQTRAAANDARDDVAQFAR